MPRDGLGSPLVNRPVKLDGGLDVKWTPNAVTALDGTINPDFSQVESDVAQLSVNQRFALFYSEKRPFFLEGIDLFATPIQAVYTRTITAPRWGARVTGKLGGTSYTALVTEDKGGGSVILPGPNGSDFADQDFRSFVAVGRVRHEIGNSFAGLLVADREVQGGGYNRVIGPDFQWRPTSARHRPGAAPRERLGDPEPARARRRVGRAKALRPRGRRVGLAQRRGIRRVRRVQGLREGVSRGRRLRPAGRLPGGLLRDGVHLATEERAGQPLQSVPDRRLPGRDGGPADLPADLARVRDGRPLELVHAHPGRVRPRARRRRHDSPHAARLHRAAQPLPRPLADHPRRVPGRGGRFRRGAAGPRGPGHGLREHPPHGSPGAAVRRRRPLAEREALRRGRGEAPLHGAGGAPEGHVHLHRPLVSAAHRPVRLDETGPVAVRGPGQPSATARSAARFSSRTS